MTRCKVARPEEFEVLRFHLYSLSRWDGEDTAKTFLASVVQPAPGRAFYPSLRPYPVHTAVSIRGKSTIP